MLDSFNNGLDFASSALLLPPIWRWTPSMMDLFDAGYIQCWTCLASLSFWLLPLNWCWPCSMLELFDAGLIQCWTISETDMFATGFIWCWICSMLDSFDTRLIQCWTHLKLYSFTAGLICNWTCLPLDLFATGLVCYWTHSLLDLFTAGLICHWTCLMLAGLADTGTHLPVTHLPLDLCATCSTLDWFNAAFIWCWTSSKLHSFDDGQIQQ